MKTFRTLICLTLMAVVATAGIADEKEKKGKKNEARKGPTATERLVGKLELTAEQKTQVAAIDKQFADRVKDLAAKRKDILTPEQQKAQAAAAKAAREAKAAGKEVEGGKRDGGIELTDEQKEQQKELNTVQQALNQEVIAALKKVLTPEQIEQLPKGRPAGKAKGDAPKGEKPKKKKEAAE